MAKAAVDVEVVAMQLRPTHGRLRSRGEQHTARYEQNEQLRSTGEHPKRLPHLDFYTA
jgi:hypothetical protein